MVRTVIGDRADYVILQHETVEKMLDAGWVRIADGVLPDLAEEVEDLTTEDTDVSAAQERVIVPRAWETCGERCQIVQIRQGDALELRYWQKVGGEYDSCRGVAQSANTTQPLSYAISTTPPTTTKSWLVGRPHSPQ